MVVEVVVEAVMRQMVALIGQLLFQQFGQCIFDVCLQVLRYQLSSLRVITTSKFC